jgi:hypothetical protein
VLQVNYKYYDKYTSIKNHNSQPSNIQLWLQVIIEIEESKHSACGKLYPEEVLRYGSLAIAAAATQPEVAEQGDEVLSRQVVLASLAMRGRIQDRFTSRQAINAYIEKATHRQS